MTGGSTTICPGTEASRCADEADRDTRERSFVERPPPAFLPTMSPCMTTRERRMFMDPHTTWTALLDAYHEGEWGRVEELADALLGWLERGGACPKVTGSGRDPDVVRGFCAHALETALEGVTWTLAD